MPVDAWSLIAVPMIGTPSGTRPSRLLVWVKLSSSVFFESKVSTWAGSKPGTEARNPADWPPVRIAGIGPDCGRSPRMK